MVPEPGNPLSYNRYSYVFNNPLRYIDPTGHFNEDEICKYWGYCGDEAKRMAEEDLGEELISVMWNTDITWGDTVYIENDQGKVQSYVFYLFETENGSYQGGFWSVDQGEKGKLNSASINNAVGLHQNENGTLDIEGSMSTLESTEWLARKGIKDPKVYNLNEIPDNSEVYNLGTYYIYDAYWWADLTAFVVSGVSGSGWIVKLSAVLGGVGYITDFGAGIMDGPIDATYPIATFAKPPGYRYVSKSGGYRPPFVYSGEDYIQNRYRPFLHWHTIP
jgi:hypothetical protein